MWFVAAKDLETRLLDVYPSNLFFVIDEDRKLYKLFQPSNANDFNEKQRYGQKHGKYCVLFHILALSGKSIIAHPFLTIWCSGVCLVRNSAAHG